MYVPIALFISYESPFPWYLGPLLQLLGFSFLFMTRFTYRYHQQWPRGYYWFSGIIRPVGIALIALAWVEITAYVPAIKVHNLFLYNFVKLFWFILALCFLLATRFFMKGFVIWLASTLPVTFITFTVAGVKFQVVVASICAMALLYAIWSIWTLGLRRSFLFSKVDDPLIESGPYSFHRHPQLFAALMLTYFSIFLIDPFMGSKASAVFYRFMNFLVMAGCTLFVTKYEDKDLLQRIPDKYLDYQSKVPAFWGISKIGKSPSFLKLLAFVIASYFWGFALLGLFPLLGKTISPQDPVFRISMNLGAERGAFMGTSEWDLYHIFHYGYRNQDGGYPQILPADMIEQWRNSRAVKKSVFPRTLFYCGKVYFSTEDPQKQSYLQKRKLTLVRELPFDLICTKDEVEIAQATDYDNDGFAQIFLLKISAANKGYNPPRLVADDETDSYVDSTKKRLKNP